MKIFKEDDVVALEIYTAFNLNKTIIPVLVDGATMPAREALPAKLKFLSLLNGFTLTHDKWKSDVALLIERIENKISDHEKEFIKKNTPPAPTPKADQAKRLSIIYEKAVLLTTPYRRFDSADESFSSINLSQNADHMLIGHKNGQLDLVDTKGFTILQSLQTGGGQIECADLSSDGKWVVIGKDKTFFGPAPATLWDLAKKQKVKNLDLNRRTYNINFSADGKMVTATGFNTFTSNKSVLFQVGTGETLPLGSYDRVFFTTDGKIIIGFSMGGAGGADDDVWSTLEVYDLHTRRWNKPPLIYAYNSIVSRGLIDVSKNGRYFIYSKNRHAIELARLNSEENKITLVKTTATLDPELKARLRKIHFSPDDALVVGITQDNEVLIVEPIKGKILKRYSFNLVISNALLSPDHKRLITLSPSGVYIWDVG